MNTKGTPNRGARITTLDDGVRRARHRMTTTDRATALVAFTRCCDEHIVYRVYYTSQLHQALHHADVGQAVQLVGTFNRSGVFVQNAGYLPPATSPLGCPLCRSAGAPNCFTCGGAGVVQVIGGELFRVAVAVERSAA